MRVKKHLFAAVIVMANLELGKIAMLKNLSYANFNECNCTIKKIFDSMKKKKKKNFL